MKRFEIIKESLEAEQISIRPPAFEKLQSFCIALPNVSMTSTFEKTEFRVGQRSFVVVETHRNPDGTAFQCMAFKASFLDCERLTKNPRYFPAPYLGGSGWLGCRLDHPKTPIDWQEIEPILLRSYRQIAGRGLSRRGTTPDIVSVAGRPQLGSID